MNNSIPDPFSVEEHDESGVKVIEVAGEWMAIHADQAGGMAALSLRLT